MVFENVKMWFQSPPFISLTSNTSDIHLRGCTLQSTTAVAATAEFINCGGFTITTWYITNNLFSAVDIAAGSRELFDSVGASTTIFIHGNAFYNVGGTVASGLASGDFIPTDSNEGL
jgi:hypothetical protein